MKIALPTRGKEVDAHFGHCEYYTVFTTDDNKKIISSEIVESPQGCGCKSDIAFVLKNMGVTVMLAGNMGNGAVNVLTNNNISVIRGCAGDVSQVAQAYLNNEISDSGTSCDSHEHGHGHGHDHGHSCSHHS